MKVQLLPSSFSYDVAESQRQHLSCIVVDDTVAFDAGSLALSCSDLQRENIRDVVISHAHLDHIAGLPIFVDDLFSTLTEPVRIHATAETLDSLQRHIFNWSVYPDFAELKNSFGPVVEYHSFERGVPFEIKHLSFTPFEVNHNKASIGVLVSNGERSVGITGDTAQTNDIWAQFAACMDLAAVLVECAFPDRLNELAEVSNHLTPSGLSSELQKLGRDDVPVYVINIKPMYREQVVTELEALKNRQLKVLEIGRVYEF